VRVTALFAAMAGRAVSADVDLAGVDDAGAGAVVQAPNSAAAPIASHRAQREGEIKKRGSFIRQVGGHRQDTSRSQAIFQRPFPGFSEAKFTEIPNEYFWISGANKT
jgi:hypothetical protein